MKLHTAYPYSLLRYGLPRSYPSLSRNIQTDVAIIGAGITGALAAWYLSCAGVSCVLVDKRHVATGSTAASTSLIQYELDVPLHDLVKRIGYLRAVKSYRACLEALHELERLSTLEALECGFEPRGSLQYASARGDGPGLVEEYRLRQKEGFKVSYFDEAELREKYGFARWGGLYSEEAAQLDAYLLAYGLVGQVELAGGAVYDHTPIVAIEHERRGVVLHTDEGHRIRARKLVIACGYESQQYITQPVEQLYTTYALISEPLAADAFWYHNSLIWETARPYLYMRATPEGRILVGGKDTPYDSRTGYRLLPAKARALRAAFEGLFPHLRLKTDFAWAGVFGGSKDGLPYIGTLPDRPHTYFALGYGGNGITFSVVAAQLIRDWITGRRNDYTALFSFNR